MNVYRDPRKLIPSIPLEPTKAPTLYEQLWFKLDGAYQRYRDIKRRNERATAVEPHDASGESWARGRAVGLVQAISIMSQGVLDEEEVQAMCVKRWRARQPKRSRSS